MKRLPLCDESRRLFCAFVMRIVDVLDNGLAGMQHVCIWHVMHEEQQLIRAVREWLINLLLFGRILPDVSGPSRNCAVHANALRIGAVPLAPAVPLRRFDSGAIMWAQNVGESTRSERPCIALIDVPRRKQHLRDRINNFGIVAEGQPRPFIRDLFCAQIWIPRHASEGIKISHGQWVTQPVVVKTNVHYCIESAEWPMPSLPNHNLLYRSRALHVHIEVEDLFPHWREETEMALLAGVLLRNLQLNRLICLQHCAEQRRGWLAYLEVDWPVLNLDDDIVVELAVEGMEVVVGGASAVSFRITPVQVMVVNEGAVEQDSAVRTQRACNHVRSVSGAAAVLRRTGAVFGIRLD